MRFFYAFQSSAWFYCGLTGLMLSAVLCGNWALAMPPAVEQSVYQQQVRQVREGDPAADFTVLRLAYARHRQAAVNAEQLTTLNRELFQAMDRDDFAHCAALAEQALAQNYTSLQSHYGAMVCQFQLGDDQRGQHHQWVLQGLLGSVRAGRDGTTPQSAFRVIAADEVSGFLRLMGYQVRERQALDLDGKQLEVATVYDSQAEQELRLYFDTISNGTTAAAQ